MGRIKAYIAELMDGPLDGQHRAVPKNLSRHTDLVFVDGGPVVPSEQVRESEAWPGMAGKLYQQIGSWVPEENVAGESIMVCMFLHQEEES